MNDKEKTYLIDTKVVRRELINKILIIGIIVFTVIVTAVVSGILISNAYHEKVFAEYVKQMEEVPEENTSIIEQILPEGNTSILEQISPEAVIDNGEQEVVKEEKVLPVYSENAKNRMQNIYKKTSEEKIAYLTFDDGPSSNITPQILQILENEGIKATFFVLGSRAELYPDLIKQEYEAGHYIANHGYSHIYSSIYSSSQAVLDEYNRTEAAIRQALQNENYSSHLFRFPGGSAGGKYSKIKKATIPVLEQNNIAHVDWNALTNDSVGKPTAESLISTLKSTSAGKNNLVVLMHDAGNKQLTVDTLGTAISYLREQGYSFKNFYDIMCE